MRGNISVEMLDEQENLIKKMSLNEIPLKEEYILEISKEEYDNEEPCVIIRTCIRNNIYSKFSKFLKSINKKSEGKVCISNLSREFLDSFDIDDNVSIIKFIREGR